MAAEVAAEDLVKTGVQEGYGDHIALWPSVPFLSLIQGGEQRGRDPLGLL